jgi:hypothetical protein
VNMVWTDGQRCASMRGRTRLRRWMSGRPSSKTCRYGNA